MNKIFSIMILIIFSIQIVNAETIIYDIPSTSNLKVIKIDDIANVKYLNEYPYEVYINGSFYGTFKEDDNILIPDGANVLIYASPQIKTDFNTAYDVGKVYLTLGIMYFIGFGILILLIVMGIKKIWK